MGDGFGMIQAYYIYCVLYFYYYYISSTSDHQALDPGGWGPLQCREIKLFYISHCSYKKPGLLRLFKYLENLINSCWLVNLLWYDRIIKFPNFPGLQNAYSLDEIPEASQAAPVVKCLSANAGDLRDASLSLGQDPLEEEMPTLSNIFWQENPTDRRASWETVHRVARSQTRLEQVSVQAQTRSLG